MTDREIQLREVLAKGGHTVRVVRTLPNLLNQVLVEIDACNLGADDFQRFIDTGLRVFQRPTANTYSMTFAAAQPPPADPARYTDKQIREIEELLRGASAEVEAAHGIVSKLVYKQ